MRIGIIGGGAAGLGTAWLLQDHHEVTLFEKQKRPGGHADTVEVEQDGQTIGIDAGFEFFMDSIFPTFMALLDLLKVPLNRYPLTATYYTTDQHEIMVLPPFKDWRIIWSALKPQQIATLLQLQRTLDIAQGLMKSADTTITLEKFVDALPVSASFKNGFLYPFLLAGWCVEMEEFKQFAAYNALRYVAMNRPGGLKPPEGVEVVGGTQNYIKALARALTKTRIKLAVTINTITRQGTTYTITEADGTANEVDHLVVATSPWDAYKLLAQLPGVEQVRRELGRIESFKTVIAVHADRRLMPAQEKYWSVVNIRYDGLHASNTVWKSWKSKKPIFRSWVTFDAAMPDSLYAVAEYAHCKINLNYFEARQHLIARQGQDNLWLAGLYMHDIDSHESALMSAVNIAKALDPKSGNLHKLLVSRLSSARSSFRRPLP
jgi:predicted NAD/FAD-binding protein